MTVNSVLPIKVVLFPCWLLPSLPLLELEAVVTAIVEVAVVVESVLSPEQTSTVNIIV